MTDTEFKNRIEALREQYALDSDTEDPEEWDTVTAAYWEAESQLWELHHGHPYTRPRPRPH